MNINNLFSNLKIFNKQDFLNNTEAVYIYGAGNIGKEVKQVIEKYNIKILGFIDKNARTKGKFIDNYPLYSLDDMKSLDLRNKKIKIIIAIFNRDVNLLNVISDIRKYCNSDIINFTEFYQYFAEDCNSHYWLEKTTYFDQNKDKIIKLYNLFEDDISKKIFYDTFLYRLTTDVKYAPLPDNKSQYFDKELINLTPDTNFIDCGAYNGDTIEELHKVFGKINKIAAFEPDLNNFKELSLNINKYDYANEIYIWPCGISNEIKSIRFGIGLGEASAIGINSNQYQEIICVSIDDILNNFRPDYIKMDIEGAEFEALNGAKQTIQKYKPKLAISIYHKPDDFWKIINLLQEWDLGYKFKLRVYAYNSFETVLYAL